ncbi:hypothetical protein NMG60_11030974 [Bertholletia excelsa]
MKDLSFFLLKNYFGSKIRRGRRSFCSGETSTSTLNQKFPAADDPWTAAAPSPVIGDACKTPPTLEEMILRLEFEERMAAARTAVPAGDQCARPRMSCSCVDSSDDVLRSARNALNRYPGRFSLDGKDAMYRSSFSGRTGQRKGMNRVRFGTESENAPFLPPVVAGESVVWCKPGVVAKLMGLEAVPVPTQSKLSRKEKMGSAIKRQNLRKRAERVQEMERRLGLMDAKRGTMGGSGYCVMKPINVELAQDGDGWPDLCFR